MSVALQPIEGDRTLTTDPAEAGRSAFESTQRERHRAQVHTPLFPRLFELAAPILRDHHADLGHDTLWLSRQPVGTFLLWAPRQSSTHIANIARDNLPTGMHFVRAVDATMGAGPWYLLTVTARRGQDLTDGTATELLPENLWHQLDQLLPRK